MASVSAKIRIAAPPEAVFDAVSDHETFVRLPGTSTTLVKPGTDSPGGLGCLREVRVGPLRFLEEITAWQPPNAYEYTIRESTLPLRHDGSRLSLRAVDGGTEVEWSGAMEISLPLIGPVVTRLFGARLEASFRAMLERAKQRLEGRA